MLMEYNRARKMGEKEYKRLVARGLSPFVPALERILPDLNTRPQLPLGVMEIPLDMIAGTVTAGRVDAFSPSFLPLIREGTEFAAKWVSLYQAQISVGITDAIKVYEYKRAFYVLEGNKRVSVLKYLGNPTIEADVVRILPEAEDSDEYRLYQEFTRFYDVTEIYEIGLSRPGDYEILAEILGRDLREPWPEAFTGLLREAYWRFLQLFDRRDGLDMDMEPGDVFLAYLRFFPPETLVYDDDAALVRRFTRIRRELRTEGNKANITYVETPGHAEKTAGRGKLTSIIGSALTTGYSEKKPLRIAFLHQRDAATSSRVRSHELGRKYIEEHFGGLVETFCYENCLTPSEINEEGREVDPPQGTPRTAAPKTDASTLRFDRFDQAIDDACAHGCEVIITTSPALMPRVMVAALQHPDVRFLNCSVNLSHSTIRCYDSRMYEVKFMMGALAACFAENHQIGYLAGTPTYGSIANINAFAIGASMVDPFAKVHLAWRRQEGVDWQKQMREAGISVFSDTDFVSLAEDDKPYGLYALLPDGTRRHLATPVWNWGRYYELIARSLLEGHYDAPALTRKDQALNYWLGISSGVVDIRPDPDLPYASRNMTDRLRDGLLAGTLSPFGGEVHSQEGIVRRAGDPALSRNDILTMDWLNENVVGTIPPAWSLDLYAQSVAAVSGVKK